MHAVALTDEAARMLNAQRRATAPAAPVCADIGVNTDAPAPSESAAGAETDAGEAQTAAKVAPAAPGRVRAADRRDAFSAARSLAQNACDLSRAADAQTAALLGRLESTTNAFDAYSRAAQAPDEAHAGVMRELRDAQRAVAGFSGMLSQLSGTNEDLKRNVVQTAALYERAQRRIRELEARDARQAVALQDELLHSLAAPETGGAPEVVALSTLQAMGGALDMLASLGLADDSLVA
jgi:hypothetical protein